MSRASSDSKHSSPQGKPHSSSSTAAMAKLMNAAVVRGAKAKAAAKAKRK